MVVDSVLMSMEACGDFLYRKISIHTFFGGVNSAEIGIAMSMLADPDEGTL